MLVYTSEVRPMLTVHFRQASQQLPGVSCMLVQFSAIPSDTKLPWEWEFSGFVTALSIIFLATIYPTVGVFHLQ